MELTDDDCPQCLSKKDECPPGCILGPYHKRIMELEAQIGGTAASIADRRDAVEKELRASLDGAQKDLALLMAEREERMR